MTLPSGSMRPVRLLLASYTVVRTFPSGSAVVTHRQPASYPKLVVSDSGSTLAILCPLASYTLVQMLPSGFVQLTARFAAS